jgi:pimeloyl-ACP methyl ester carboxylesterase
MRPVIAALLTALGLGACARPDLPSVPSTDPLVYDPAEVARAEKIAIVVPGALASVSIFAPVDEWRQQGYAVVKYRFPGLDGLPLDHRLTIDAAAARVVAFAREHGDRPIRLLGYSTGGAIVLSAAAQLADLPDLKVAAISPAPPAAGGAETAVRGIADVAAAAVRAGSIRRGPVWKEYFRTLLFGRPGLRDPALAALSRRIVEDQDRRIATPDPLISEAHTRDLRRWRPAAGTLASPAETALFVGRDDPVFSLGQWQRLARMAGNATVLAYPRNGHLLFMTAPGLFGDVLSFFEAPARPRGD